MQQQQPTVQLDVDPELLVPVFGLGHLAEGLFHTEHLLCQLGLDGALARLNVLQGKGSRGPGLRQAPAEETMSRVDQARGKMSSPIGVMQHSPRSSWPRTPRDAQLSK